MSDKKNKDNYTSRSRKFGYVEIISLISLTLCFFIAIGVYFLQFTSLSDDPNDFGSFGNYIGGSLGAIIGGVGIVFLYRTYRMQLDISSKQESNQKIERFESTFFGMLNQQREIIVNLKGNFTEFDKNMNALLKEYAGYDYISRLRLSLSEHLSSLESEPDILKPDKKFTLRKRINDFYGEMFSCNVSQLGHYFRHLYHILKYINMEEGIDKKKYFDIVQSQMSADELYLLTFNGISNYGRKRLLPILNDNSFLENVIIDDDKIVKAVISMFYPDTKLKEINLKPRNIIFVGGVYGVGKSTFISDVCRSMKGIEAKECSELIKWSKEKKEVKDIPGNQLKLIEAINQNLDEDKPYLLSGHFCLLNADGKSERIPKSTFESINPALIIFLKDDFKRILKNLKERDGRAMNEQSIELMYHDEYVYSHEVADTYNIDLVEIDLSRDDDKLNAISCIEKHISLFK